MDEIRIALLVLGGAGLIFSILLAFLSKKLKVKEDPRVEKIIEILPGINCGACGFSGCRAFAEAVVKENKIFKGCLPGGTEVNSQIADILGIKTAGQSGDKRVAVCRCGASNQGKKRSSAYNGPQTCRAADITGGAIDCSYGCIGFGDCVKVCPVNAISIVDGKVEVDISTCIGCGNCVRACPRHLFMFRPYKDKIYYVACNNREKALAVKKVCTRGCIACGICVRVNNSPFYLKDNLSYLDWAKAEGVAPLEEAKKKCPTKCILVIGND